MNKSCRSLKHSNKASGPLRYCWWLNSCEASPASIGKYESRRATFQPSTEGDSNMDTTWSCIFDWHHLTFIVRPKSFVQPPLQQERNMMPCLVVCCWFCTPRCSLHPNFEGKTTCLQFAQLNNRPRLIYMCPFVVVLQKGGVPQTSPHWSFQMTPKPNLDEQR